MTPQEMAKKYPQLYPIYVNLQKERAELTEGLAELEAEANTLYTKVTEAQQAWAAVREKIVEKEGQGRLREVSNQLAALARNMGATSIKVESGQMGVEPTPKS